jgi:amino acid adenylation domain-containing protein
MVTGIRKYAPIPVNTRTRHSPLTFQQERVLYFCELNPDSSIWDINTCKRLIGKLDVSLLEQAVRQLIEHHQVLRTRIQRGADGPSQSFDQDTSKAFRYIKLSRKAKHDAESALGAQISRICQKPISRWTYDELLFEVVLIALSERDHVLLLRVHHIISDAASVDLLWRDLTVIYNNLVCGIPVSLSRKTIQYSDYALWQRHQFSVKQTQEQENYWLEQFHDEPPVLDLPADSLPSPTLSFKGGLAIIEIPGDLIEKFQRLSWERRVLLFSSLFSVYFVLLQKFCQQEDITTGVLFSGRHYCPELLDLAGFFVNMTAVRVNVLRQYTFGELVDQVQKQVEAAYFMQDYPFERLVQKLAPKRGDSRVPLVRTMFNVVSNLPDENLFAGLERETWIDVATQTNSVQVDLIFDLHWGSSGAEVRIEHNTDIFQAGTVVRLAKHYITLLRQLSSGWNVALSELELVDEDEKRQLVEGWNPASTPYAREKCVHELFEEQVLRKPDDIAIVDGDMTFTYAEANQKANRLARSLRKLGIGPDSIVGIIGGRTAEMVIGQIGILKAGGAYLPIPANSPRRRVQEMLQDARPPVLIVPSDCHEDFGFGGAVLRLSDCDDPGMDSGNLDSRTTPLNLAYVIYTSGSTGTPKGVMVQHRSVINLATNFDYLELRPDDRILQTGAPAFDATTFEIWGALLNGLRLYVVREELLLQASALGKFLLRNHVTIMFMVPPLFNHLVEQDPSLFRPLRYVIAGGDVLSLKHAEQARKANPSLIVVNAYGPTENTTYSTCYQVIQTERRSIPIGKPIPNSVAYILDSEMKLSPIGAVGELYVGGDGLARGYLNRSALTAERFIPNPFVPGSRIYKTGDLVRRRADGMIEFLGRADRQVKIRGFRIELGEIENRLLEHANIKEGAVTSVTGTDGNKFLCAYYVAQPKVTNTELRAHLAGLLPAYMVPSYFCPMDQMPLTESGKIDQRSLPEPQIAGDAGTAPALLRSATEKSVARIWEELLGISTIGAQDNFFEIGGHSLKAGVLASRLTAEFGVNVSLRTVFDFPTVAELAMVVANGTGKECRDGAA